MTQTQLNQAVAKLTGETKQTIAHRGFGPLRRWPHDEADDPLLCLDCPGCGSQILLANTPEDLPELAECPSCDTLFDFTDEEIYAACVHELSTPRRRPLIHAA